jgi:Asp-tRNA(Asn)/Glu-tRNA(Gln) amidotransferase A subunit family amidase
MVPLALATQTNGSTIRPASFCGVVGFKPSLGVLPRTGILKQSTMLDQPGLMAADVAGVALLADALGGYDPLDEQSLQPPLPLLSAATIEAEAPPRLAFIGSPYWDQADETTQEAIEEYVASLGGVAETVALPALFDDAASIQGVIMNAGIADACRDDYVRSRDRMSDVLLGIVETGRRISAMEFIAALAQRDRLRARYAEIVAGYDAVVTPAALGIAPKHEAGTGNPIMATLWTLLGAPAITLPLLTGAENMPVGVQFVGRLNDDVGLIRAAAWLERHHACKSR